MPFTVTLKGPSMGVEGPEHERTHLGTIQSTQVVGDAIHEFGHGFLDFLLEYHDLGTLDLQEHEAVEKSW